MLVEGACKNGHELICTVREGKLRGVVTKGMLRVTCPRCGADVVVQVESSVLTLSPASSRREAG
jgi:hypothetical protein